MDFEGEKFGNAMKNKYFHMQDNFVNFNCGSFGTTPKLVKNEQDRLFLQQEAHPDEWFRVLMYENIEKTRKSVASLINAPVSDIVLVENASGAVNSILRSFNFKKGDRILRLSNAYNMVVNTLDWLVKTVGIEVIVVRVDFPLVDNQQVLRDVEHALQQYNNVKFALFSHVTSFPSWIEPVKELIQVCKKDYHSSNSEPVRVIVDAAHAPGMVHIDIQDMKPDYYIGNGHKWLFGCKGSGFLYVNQDNQALYSPAPTVISARPDWSFAERYAYVGTKDYTSMIALRYAIDEFIGVKLGGLNNVIDYNMRLASEAAELLCKMWKSHLLVPIEYCGNMFNVVFPSYMSEDSLKYIQLKMNEGRSGVPGKKDHAKLYFMYGFIDTGATMCNNNTVLTFGSQPNSNIHLITAGASGYSDIYDYFTAAKNASVPTVASIDRNTVFFTRLSSQVYLELSDFELLGHLVLEYFEEYKTLNSKQ